MSTAGGDTDPQARGADPHIDPNGSLLIGGYSQELYTNNNQQRL